MWAIAQVTGALSDARLERLFGPPSCQRLLFTALARRFDARAADGFEGRISYELTRPATGGKATLHTITVTGGEATARPGGADQASVRLSMPVADFVRAAAGAIDPAEPVLKSRAKVKGDLELTARLPEMFRAPRPR